MYPPDDHDSRETERDSAARPAIHPDRPDRPDRASLLTRTMLWAVLLICGALLVATISEAWQRHTMDQQVAAAQARNAALQQQNSATQRAITIAESPDTIEREARAWGYVRPGEHPIVVVTPPTK